MPTFNSGGTEFVVSDDAVKRLRLLYRMQSTTGESVQLTELEDIHVEDIPDIILKLASLEEVSIPPGTVVNEDGFSLEDIIGDTNKDILEYESESELVKMMILAIAYHAVEWIPQLIGLIIMYQLRHKSAEQIRDTFGIAPITDPVDIAMIRREHAWVTEPTTVPVPDAPIKLAEPVATPSRAPRGITAGGDVRRTASSLTGRRVVRRRGGRRATSRRVVKRAARRRRAAKPKPKPKGGLRLHMAM